MKKGILLLIAILGFVNLSANNNIGVNYQNNDAVTFIDRGVEFHVFLNGDFDFNAINNNRYNNRLRVLRDNFGRVRQVGNTVINYGFNGAVSAIGNVPVRYQFGQLASVGNLVVEYDRWGYPHYRGFVKQNRFYNDGFTFNVNLGSVFAYDNSYFYDRHFRNNYRRFREDANFFYYRAIPNARIGNRSTIIKRRKPTRAVVTSNNRYINNKRRAISNTRTVDRNRTYNRTATPVTKNVKKTKVVRTTPTTNRKTVTNRNVTRTVKSTPTKTRTNSTTINNNRDTKVVKTVTTKKTSTTNNRSTTKRNRR